MTLKFKVTSAVGNFSKSYIPRKNRPNAY